MNFIETSDRDDMVAVYIRHEPCVKRESKWNAPDVGRPQSIPLTCGSIRRWYGDVGNVETNLAYKAKNGKYMSVVFSCVCLQTLNVK
jgi:hypothetical protein